MINRTVFFHYRTQVLCRVSQTLGKDRKTLGKLLAECSTRQSAHGLSSTGEAGFAECLFSGTRQTFAVCQVALGKKSWNGTDGRTVELANGTANWRTGLVENFAECHMLGTRQRFKLRRVPSWQHSTKFEYVPTATRPALGKVSDFAECQSNCTRRILFPENKKMVALPSVKVITLGKACCFFYFFCFLCNNHIH